VARWLAALTLVCSLALPACGDDDDERREAEQTVRAFVKATNDRDVDAICGRLLTQEFLERNTGGVGEGAERACHSQLRTARGLRTRLVRIARVKVDGERASVRAVLVTQGHEGVRVFQVVREDDDWKLAGARGE
jgi:limonene-1,2-epoxide hydrolase